jgi:hypothetical protein
VIVAGDSGENGQRNIVRARPKPTERLNGSETRLCIILGGINDELYEIRTVTVPA